MPSLELTSPGRGTFADGPLVVAGRVRDDGPVRVTVGGVEVPVAADGTFSTTITAPRGIAIVETHAIDTTGHDVRDVRAVLVGPFAPIQGPPAALGARLGRGGMTTLGKLLAASAKAVDPSTAAKALNPVYNNPGCLGARVDITDVSIGKVDIALVPRLGAIDAVVTVDDILIRLGVDYEVACLGGQTTMTVRTRARLSGELQARLAEGRIRTGFGKPSVSLGDFELDVAGLPGPLHRVIRPALRTGVEAALAAAVWLKVPAIADARLAELFGKSHAGELLERKIDVAVTPRMLELTHAGLLVAADARLGVMGGETGRYLAAEPGRGPGETPNLKIAFAVDAINRLFAGLWAARALDRTIPIAEAGPLRMLLDDDVATIQLVMALPPTATADGKLELAIGDLTITGRDASGKDVQQLAISLRTSLGIKPGELALTTGDPVVHVQLLAQSAAVQHPLDAAGLEGLVKGAWWLVDGMLNAPLARLPLPAFGGALEVRSLTATGGTIELELATR